MMLYKVLNMVFGTDSSQKCVYVVSYVNYNEGIGRSLKNTKWKVTVNCSTKNRVREVEKIEENIAEEIDIFWP